MKPAFLIAFLMSCVTAMGQAPSVEVWAVPSVAKVRPDDRVQGHNLVWDKSTKTISIAGAKNEHVPFQIVITVPPSPDSHHPAASGFFVEASDLVAGAKGRLHFGQFSLSDFISWLMGSSRWFKR